MEYEKNVFINCPFDNEYLPLLRTLLFTILYHNFEPRIAKENSDSGIPRIEKIKNLIAESKFSIHDISRIQSIKKKEYYRLNMPFELGIDFGCRLYSGIAHSGKRFLILEKESYRYMKAFSDINGFDIKSHKNEPQEVVRAVRDWFVETVNYKGAKSTAKIWYNFNDFMANLFDEKIKDGFSHSDIDFMPIPEFIENIKIWLISKNQMN